MKTKKKRNPADLTSRNNKARKKEIALIEQRLTALTLDINEVYERLSSMENYVDTLREHIILTSDKKRGAK